MYRIKLYELYEKLYFHEIDMRENLNSRVQIPLAILISVIGLLAFMLRNFSHSGNEILFDLFLILYLSSLVATFIGIYNLVKSWYGYDYSFIPSASESDKYRLLLIDTYKSFDNHELLVDKYFFEYINTYYIECSSINTANNDKRSLYLHLTTKYIIISTLFSFLSFMPFYFGKFDKNTKNTITSVKICEPLEIKGVLMTKEQTNTPPLPPPPPPKRVIKEGVEIKTPPKPSK